MDPTQPKRAIDCEPLKQLIREVPDFPKKGILFYDITTLLKDKRGFATLIDALSEHYLDKNVDLVLGIEARGFIFGPAVAHRLNAGFVPIRKPKKLPAETVRWTYELEYGSDTLEIHRDAINAGQRHQEQEGACERSQALGSPFVDRENRLSEKRNGSPQQNSLGCGGNGHYTGASPMWPATHPQRSRLLHSSEERTGESRELAGGLISSSRAKRGIALRSG